MGFLALGAAIAVLTGAAAGIGIALQPEAAGQIRSTLLIGCALAEATAIYGFVIGLLVIILLK